MRLLCNTRSLEKARPFLIDGDYEVAGVFPGGSVYLHTRDRAIDSVEKLQGKRIATLDLYKGVIPDGVYDERAISLMKAIRCRVDDSRSECAS